MSRRFFAFLASGTAAAILGGCGSTAHFADRTRPPTPVDLTVYINDARVSVSPASVGAGPVMFYVTNQASHSESLSIQPSGDGRTLATTGPINPGGGTAQVQVDFSRGDYQLTSSTGGGTDAQAATAKPISPATLHIGASRPSSNSAVLQP
jgi:hypothetical protein